MARKGRGDGTIIDVSISLSHGLIAKRGNFRGSSPAMLVDGYTAACSGSLSAERASLGIGMFTITEVPESFDAIFISP
jgi:hypothetical protein